MEYSYKEYYNRVRSILGLENEPDSEISKTRNKCDNLSVEQIYHLGEVSKILITNQLLSVGKASLKIEIANDAISIS